jgi:hypothetical protein
MADDAVDVRPADDPITMIAAMQKQLDDLQSTLSVQANRRPTGTIEATLLPSGGTDTLVLNGATLNRADYLVLVQWATDNGLFVTNGFGVGDGSTTFTLPNFQGLVLSGADATNPLLAKFGAATYGPAALPSHTHAITNHPDHDHVSNGTNGAGDHHHGINNDGNHGGHASGGSVLVPSGSFFGVLPGDPQSPGNHAHLGATGTDGSHTHVVDIQPGSVSAHVVASSGTGATASLRPPSISINWIIWT